MPAHVPNITLPWTAVGTRAVGPRAPTPEDVARVSRALVSLVARPSPKVGRHSRVKVLAGGEEPGYRPDPHARNLGANSGDIIAADLHNPFFAGVVDGRQADGGRAASRLISLTTAHPPTPHMGRLALRQRTQGRTETVRHAVATSLVVRTTSAPVRVAGVIPPPIPQESPA